MNKIISILVATILIFSFSITADASEISVNNDTNSTYEDSDIIDLGDGHTIIYINTEVVSNARIMTKSAVKTANCEYDGKIVATIKLTASYTYNGATAYCTSASSSYTMNDGWTYSNRSTTRVGDTATTSAKLSKGIRYANINISMRCTGKGELI